MEKYKFLSFQYFEGKITKEDEQMLFDFISAAPNNKMLFKQWETEWFSTFQNAETNDAWKALLNKLDSVPSLVEAVPKPGKRSLNIYRLIRVAAVTVGLILLGVAYVTQKKTELPEYAFTVEAPMGERSRMILPDGTVVWLNSGSRVEYSTDFQKSNRTISLMGEAYFEVIRNEEIPFIVKTKHCSVKVLGTRFNVSAYPDDDFTETTLIEGGVEMTGDTYEAIRMAPGERVIYNHKTNQILKEHVTAENFSSWTCSRLDFEEITLKELMKKLSRRYNVKITIASEELANKKFSGSLINGETLTEVLSAIDLIVPIEITRQGEMIYIHE